MPEETVNPPAEKPISLAGRPQEDDEPISLVDEVDEDKTASVRAISARGAKSQKKAEFQRSVNLDGAGAVRCRVFFSKIAVSSLEAMESQINGWLDNNQIEVKHVNQVIGTMVGKMAEPNLIVTVWY